MDECLVTAAVDLGGRYAFEYHAPIAASKIGTFDSELVEHFWQSMAANAKCNLHVVLHHGRNSHHIAECVFKSVARAIRMAAEDDPRSGGGRAQHQGSAVMDWARRHAGSASLSLLDPAYD